nr:hypothetical protein [Tanacetum cinerariifolium]GFA63655.1 hypothetical protein [Tanacetum cinerariifolium]
MMYMDGTVWNELNVGRKRPPTLFWTSKLLKEREYEEIKAERFGNGELQGPLLKKKAIQCLKMKMNGFVRTFTAADVVFRGNTLIAGVYQQYRKTLNYKDGISEGKSSSKLSGDNNEEPHEVCTVQIAGNTISKDYDSPVFALGQAAQKEVFTMVDKVVDEFHRSKKQNDFEAPSFSLGVTQDFEMVLSLESPVTDIHTHTPGSTHNLEPVEAVSLSMCKPVLKGEDLGNARGKRKYTKVQVVRSLFRSRVTNIKVAESKEEKEVKTYLLKKMGIDKRNRDNGINITNGKFSEWRNYRRWGCGCMMCYLLIENKNECEHDKKLFGIEAKANESVTKSLLNVEKVNERGGRKSIIKQVDLVEVKRENFYWQTDKKTYDSGVFLMRHMKAYMGNLMSKWEWELETEGKKQNTQLGRLRKRYVVTLLLSECNLHRDNIRAQLNDIEVANVHGKRMKLPRVGK